jgi:hypothetical protein
MGDEAIDARVGTPQAITSSARRLLRRDLSLTLEVEYRP